MKLRSNLNEFKKAPPGAFFVPKDYYQNMKNNSADIKAFLSERKKQSLYRSLKVSETAQQPIMRIDGKECLNFCSNDYLGLANHPDIVKAFKSAADKCGLPASVFTSVPGGNETGKALVLHSQIKAVGFTGSHRGGMALTALANSRPEPIPVYAEMEVIILFFCYPKKWQRQQKLWQRRLRARLIWGPANSAPTREFW